MYILFESRDCIIYYVKCSMMALTSIKLYFMISFVMMSYIIKRLSSAWCFKLKISNVNNQLNLMFDFLVFNDLHIVITK